MAKRRKLKPPSTSSHREAGRDDAGPDSSGLSSVDPALIAAGLLAASVVYVTYYPSDSVAVERGDALWFAALAIVIATITWATRLWRQTGDAAQRRELAGDESSRESSSGKSDDPRAPIQRWSGLLLDAGPWMLAGWMMIAAFATSPPGNLRMATNEAWFWISGAAIFTSARFLAGSVSSRKALLLLLVVCGSGQAVHGLHQHWISLPQNRSDYQRDPDRVLQLAGIDAPEGSAERMVFENRLLDGGPTGTFALANSLAAVLLFSIIVSAGSVRYRWSSLSSLQRVAWIALGLLCFSCLIAARSRSATMAMLVGLALIFMVSSHVRSSRIRATAWGLAGVALLGISGAAVLAWRGNREWFEAAPASLAFRFQYWRSTCAMVLDRPWFGAGPGNFQSIYERYREGSATEQIAEPHNLFVETWASGGFLALALLIALFSAAVVFVLARKQSDQAPAEPWFDMGGKWVWMGAILSLGLIWLIGFIGRHVPDSQAALFVIPISILLAGVLWPSLKSMSARDLDRLLAIAACSVVIHLLVSGGWTVPGVAMLVWLCGAILTRINDDNLAATNTSENPPHATEGATSTKTQLVSSGLAIASGILLLIVWNRMSLRPVETQTRLMSVAARAQSAGRSVKARQTLEQAVDADPWTPDASLWLADTYRWELILGGDRPDTRQRWQKALQTARTRAGDDPAIYRMIGAQQLHLFQRYGVTSDLQAAAESFGSAHRWAPSNEWMTAQVAAIAAAQGAKDDAERLARRAWKLSRMGNNIERDMSRQQIYVPEALGIRAKSGPIRRGADELLPEPNAFR